MFRIGYQKRNYNKTRKWNTVDFRRQLVHTSIFLNGVVPWVHGISINSKDIEHFLEKLKKSSRKRDTSEIVIETLYIYKKKTKLKLRELVNYAFNKIQPLDYCFEIWKNHVITTTTLIATNIDAEQTRITGVQSQ